MTDGSRAPSEAVQSVDRCSDLPGQIRRRPKLRSRRSRRLNVGLALVAWFSTISPWTLAASAQAAPAFYRSLDGPENVWQLETAGPPSKVLAQDHVAAGTRHSIAAERIVIAAVAGQSPSLSCAVPPMPVLDELEARLWVRANRPGVQLGLRIVLPRTNNSARPTTTVVRSEPYNQPGHWQQLVLDHVPQLMADEVRVMRATPGAAVDPREAFVDAVMVIIPGEPQGVEVFTDELALEGIVRERRSTAGMEDTAVPAGDGTAAAAASAGWHRSAQLAPNPAGPSAPSVRFAGATLLINGQPFSPRAIEWRGEPLKFLAERGFNAVWITELPTAEQSSAAAQQKLWFLSTPPRPSEIAQHGLSGLHADRVIAWYLADDAAEGNPDYFRRWAEAVRQYDAAAMRPIIIPVYSNWKSISKIADISVVEHPLGIRMSSHELERWLYEHRESLRPGTCCWVSIPTQLSDTASRQAAALSGKAGLIPCVDADRLELLSHIATIAGGRGVVFESNSSIAEQNAATRRRASQLECLNHRLAVIEPWLAAGKVIGRVSSLASSAREPPVTACLMQVDYARLLVPLHRELENSDRNVAPSFDSTSQVIDAQRVFVIPGIPSSNQAYLLSPAGMLPLESRRVAGGTSISLEPQDHGWVLLTEDPQIIHALGQRVARSAPHAARRQHALATLELTAAAATSRALAELGMSSEQANRLIATATQHTRSAAQRLASGSFEECYQQSALARRALFHVAQEQRRAVPPPSGFVSEPLSICYDTLPEHAKTVRSLDKLRGGDNLLYGGDFEKLNNLLECGWHHVTYPQTNIAARAELSAEGPKQGTYCLQLTASSRDGSQVTPPRKRDLPATTVSTSPLFHDPFQMNTDSVGTKSSAERALSPSPADDDGSILPGAPVWITSPTIPLDRAGVIEISGWIKVSEPLAGSVDALQIVDSLGGPELSLSIHETSDWQPFRLIRAVSEPSELQLAFLLSGLGVAQVDGVMIRYLSQPTVRRLPPTASTADEPQ